MAKEESTRDWSEFIPDVELPTGSLDGGVELLQGFGIVEAYRKWIGKSEPKVGSRTESIMVSCPRPDHPDKHPSAWLNNEKNLWHCGACDVGGDIIDLGAIHFNIDYRAGVEGDFVRLLEALLEDAGFDVEGLKASNADKSVPVIASTTKTASPSSPTPAARATGVDEPELADEEFGLAPYEEVPLKWKEIVDSAPGSFLSVWMEATTPGSNPNEYLFWLGAQMVGLAVGRDCSLVSGTPVYPNLTEALIGRTGDGKSRSIALARSVVAEALPFNPLDPASRGVALLGRPGSGEALYEMFSWIPLDKPQGMRGLVEVDELSELMTAARRKGSTLKESVITITDNRQQISHRSRSVGTIEVVEPFMALVTGGQPDALGKIMTGQEQASGFANRFIYVAGTPKPRAKWNERPVIDLTGVPEQLQRVRKWAGQNKLDHDGLIELEPTIAAPQFDEMLDWLDEVRRRPNGDIFARLELHAMKLLVILAVNRRTRIVDEQIVDQVRHLIETLVPITDSVSEAISLREDQWYQGKVLAKIDLCAANGEDPPNRTQLTKSLRHNKRDRVKVNDAISQLERNGTIVKVRLGEVDKRKAVDRWIINA